MLLQKSHAEREVAGKCEQRLLEHRAVVFIVTAREARVAINARGAEGVALWHATCQYEVSVLQSQDFAAHPRWYAIHRLPVSAAERDVFRNRSILRVGALPRVVFRYFFVWAGRFFLCAVSLTWVAVELGPCRPQG